MFIDIIKSTFKFLQRNFKKNDNLTLLAYFQTNKNPTMPVLKLIYLDFI